MKLKKKNGNQTEQLTLWEQQWQRGRSVAGSILVLPVNLNSFENKLDLTQITLNSFFFFVFTVFPIFIQLPSGCVSALERFIVIHFSHSHPVILPLFDCRLLVMASCPIMCGAVFLGGSVCSLQPPPSPPSHPLPPKACVYTAVWKWGRWALCSCVWENLEFKEGKLHLSTPPPPHFNET